MFPKPKPVKKIKKSRKELYDFTRYRCIQFIFDKTPLFYVHKNYPEDLLDDFISNYTLKQDLKHISCHFNKDGIIFSLEYVKSVRYYVHPKNPLRTRNGYCRLLSYNLTADPADCVNTCLLHQGAVYYDISIETYKKQK